MKYKLEETIWPCQCSNLSSPRTPNGPLAHLSIDGTPKGSYCLSGCLPSMLEAATETTTHAAVMKATTKIGDTVTWSGLSMTVLEVAEHGVRCDQDPLQVGGWYAWEVVS